MRFHVCQSGDRWAVWDAGTGGWRTETLDQCDAERRAVELNIAHEQHGPRMPAHRRLVDPPLAVDTWTAAGRLRCWVREPGCWVGLVTDPTTGREHWISAKDLRPDHRGQDG